MGHRKVILYIAISLDGYIAKPNDDLDFLSIVQQEGEDYGLIDEFIISVVPVYVGDGIKLFNDGRPEQKLSLINAKTFDLGLVQLHYKLSDK